MPQISVSAGRPRIVDETSQADGHGAATRAATPPHAAGSLRTDPCRNAQVAPKIRTASDDFEHRRACLLIRGCSRARRVPDRARNRGERRSLPDKLIRPPTWEQAGSGGGPNDLLSSGSRGLDHWPRGVLQSSTGVAMGPSWPWRLPSSYEYLAAVHPTTSAPPPRSMLSWGRSTARRWWSSSLRKSTAK
jgi:hypothetical protein